MFWPFWAKKGPKKWSKMGHFGPLFEGSPGPYLAKSACTQTNLGQPGPGDLQKGVIFDPFWVKNGTPFWSPSGRFWPGIAFIRHQNRPFWPEGLKRGSKKGSIFDPFWPKRVKSGVPFWTPF